MKKFKVGQRVKINLNGLKAEKLYRTGILLNSSMLHYNGCELKIDRYLKEGYYKINGWSWLPEWLELAEGEQPNDQWVHNGVLYNIDRVIEAKVGDLMLIVREHDGSEPYELHDVLECTGVKNNDKWFKYGSGMGDYLHKREYVVLVSARVKEEVEESEQNLSPLRDRINEKIEIIEKGLVELKKLIQ